MVNRELSKRSPWTPLAADAAHHAPAMTLPYRRPTMAP
jgi:hypothetical protein